uniref:Uncharacterized protein n=1 Tax=Siphoviridae sp. ctqBH20 TaxID=2825680 RepID=A0A8S5QCK7_9CAUD|nr:MAG TPA: hypothetical protein [Siphoviridae sp. ctqBH20]
MFNRFSSFFVHFIFVGGKWVANRLNFIPESLQNRLFPH